MRTLAIAYKCRNCGKTIKIETGTSLESEIDQQSATALINSPNLVKTVAHACTPKIFGVAELHCVYADRAAEASPIVQPTGADLRRGLLAKKVIDFKL